jgi:hypothetical protein
MRRTDPYGVEGPVTIVNDGRSVFGLIGDDQAGRAELSGYEVTISGEVVVPRLSPKTHTRHGDTQPIDSLE